LHSVIFQFVHLFAGTVWAIGQRRNC